MAVPAKMAAAKQELAEELLARHVPAPASAWADAARAEAAARLRAMGAPGRRDEYWKYTNPTKLTALAEAASALESDAFNGVDAARFVFVDGVFRADLSDALEVEGLEISLLSDALSADIHWASSVFGVIEGGEHGRTPRPLAALNTATAWEGVCIRAVGEAARPVLIDQRRTGAAVEAMIHHVIRVEPGAKVTVLEQGAAGARANTCMEVDLGEGAGFNHVRAQGPANDRLTNASVFARLEKDCAYKSFTLSVQGELTRNEHVIRLNGDDALAHVAGACLIDGDVVHDDTVFVTHDAVNCESRQVYKKVLKNGARGVFQGKIHVIEDAQKTDGYQISQALLLTEDGEFDSKPELEIYADDVACSHGSTVGAADETALFYLRSRGVPLEAAQGMIVLAFLAEALEEIEDEALADIMRDRIAHWALGGVGVDEALVEALEAEA
ncbi:Fe-S cluster assembly protein SufD [Rhodovulum sp. DZ06]|uniref:Fe-S cluster assembly protein SufD n=1 Tax=Rhodovulum sp. DZ06 TaxID=3425126 RepID=UPI003D341EB5